MTQISGFIRPSRRPGQLGIHSLDHVSFAVPSLNDAEHFYRSFGLKLQPNGDALGLFAKGHPQRWAVLTEGARKLLTHISFGAFEDDLPRFGSRLHEMGIGRVDPPSGFDSNGLWFHDLDGTLIEIRVAQKTSPNDKSTVHNLSVPAGVRGAPSRSAAAVVRPRRLAHVLLFTRDVAKAIEFYSRVIGLRLSDRSGDGVAFMHGIHGSDHHLIAFAKSNAPGLHHLSWDVGSIHDVGLGAQQMADKGFSRGWGLGRHVLGSNYFHYVRDPWGSYAEYSSDIDYIGADQDWSSGDHPAEDAYYVWGPAPPEDFAFNYEGA
jgi:catechol 2,3-dioxygenase-like lactoylglutathione lyase family enzyme